MEQSAQEAKNAGSSAQSAGDDLEVIDDPE